MAWEVCVVFFYADMLGGLDWMGNHFLSMLRVAAGKPASFVREGVCCS